MTWHTEFGVTKICFDVSMTVIAGVLSFVFAGKLDGVREGTVIAALLVGFIARLFGRFLSFVKDGILNMELVLEKFMIHFHDIYGKNTEKFVEENGRRVFLLYLKPIINGTGNYYIEAQTRDQSRTDVIVDYLGKQYVIELKIWRGNEYNKRGEKQLAEYLEYYHLEKGYLLSFNFNKNKKIGLKEVEVDNKKIIEVVV